ncbi:T9SS type B sorting domain-containing protein [Arenibacter certesii]|uniref:T9SS C-terminal target domain-containing protein n=1 Tax=Arenibacter certesii TaxID=228955 RepID=A0A918MJF5_9FLAO|nr:T9SS type B sorting domain-containing protein [Arenibacter certesii]GGW30803.1 T9SS C-terminal target domain-containing protein [Arenibacter certesii]
MTADIPSALSIVNSEVALMLEADKELAPLKIKDLTLLQPNTTPAVMFATIITNADAYDNCNNDGSSMASYALCGDFDDRLVALQGSYSSYDWQQFSPGSGCTFNVDDKCANTNIGCWNTISTNNIFNIDASSISSSTGAGYRVRVNGTGPYYYFNVKKSTITQTFVKRDFVCGTPGRIQITNLSSSYEYSIDNGIGFGPWQGAIFSDLVPGTYVVKARLQNTQNTCEYLYDPIVIEQRDIDIEMTYVDAQCSGDTGSISVAVRNVPGPYKYTLLDASGSPQEFTSFIAADNYIFSAVGFGTYSVSVETQQCKGDTALGIPPPSQDLDVNGNPIVIGEGMVAMDASTEVNNSFGCSVASVDISVKTSGGTAPYTFVVNGTGPSSSAYTSDAVYTVTSPGSYDFLITDSKGCTITASANVEELTPPNIMVSGIDGNCTNGGAKLDFNVVDAKGYNLSFRASPSDTWSTNPMITVPAGSYPTIQVRYQQGGFDCIMDMSNSVTVATTGAISGNAVKILDRTCDGMGGPIGGQIEFQGPFSGGSGSGYVFSVSGDAPVNFSTKTVYSNLAPGTYTPIIRDNGGCRLELTPITISDIDPPKAISFSQNNINCSVGTVDVQLTVTSNHSITKYEVVGPGPNIDNGSNDTFTGLNTATAYQFRVTDVNGCTYTKSFTAANISSIRARVKSGGDTQVCTGATDGTGSFIIDGFANSYTYTINGGPESVPQNSSEVVLPPSGMGTYEITVTDIDTGCTETASITILEPSTLLSLTGTVTDMSCANSNRGRVVANSTGGWSNHRYTLTPPTGAVIGPTSNRTFANLSQVGAYTMTVTDSEGCVETFNFNLTSISAPTLTLDSGASDFCFIPGTGATVAVSSAEGSAPLSSHQYQINGITSWQSSPVFTGVPQGNHTIQVRDGNNCSHSINVTVRGRLRVTTAIESDIPCGTDPGQVRVRVSGGYLSGPGPKQYEVSSDSGSSFGPPQALMSTNFLFDTSTPGIYIFRVTDNEGCVSESNPLVMDPPVGIDASANVAAASCGRTNNGIITVVPNAAIGVPPYEVNFDGRGFSSQTTYSNLNAGQTYSYIVRDSRGCVFTGSETIGTNSALPPNATVLAVDATCSPSGVYGEIEVTGVSDGSPNFTFILQNQFGAEVTRSGPTASTSHTFGGLTPGTYTVVTMDSAGCRDLDTVSIGQNMVTVVPDPITPLTCSTTGFTNTVEINGGIGPFEIRLVEDPANSFEPVNSPLRRHTFNGLQFGITYTVEVLDTNTGCIYVDSIEPVDGPTLLDVTATSTTGFCDVNRNGEIVYTIDGFNLGDELRIELVNNSNGSTMELATVIPTSVSYSNSHLTLSGNYQILVTNVTDECTDSASITIDPNLPSIDILTQRPANCNADGSITVQGTGGTGAPYEFAFMDQGNTPNLGDFVTETTFFAPAGNYDVYVKDTNGCTSFNIATVIQLEPNVTPPVITVVNQCDVNATSFEVYVSVPSTINTPRFTLGGESQFGVLNGALYEATFYVNSPGSYPVELVDGNGCTIQANAEVYEFLAVSGGFSTDPDCFNPDGTITSEVVGGSNNFSYQLQNESGGNIGTPLLGDRLAGIFTGLVAGNYRIYIEDTETLCNDTVIVNLESPIAPVIAEVNKQDIFCNGANNGSINILLQTGSELNGPIEYQLLDFDTRALITNNTSGSFGNLSPGRYEVEVISARNCSDQSGLIDVEEPLDFTISASAPDFACEVGANRYSSTIITVNVEDPGTEGSGYQFSITGHGNYQTSNTFEIIDNGNPRDITVYAVDGNGCRTEFVIPTINPPTDVVPTLSVDKVLDCKDPEQIRIDVVGTNNFTVTINSIVPMAPITVSGDNFVIIDLPAAGDYLFEITDNIGSCTYPLPKHTVNEPIVPMAVINEVKPITCFGADDGELTINVTNYSGNYTYNVYRSNDISASTSIRTGMSNTNNNPERITDLPGGNFYVVISSDDVPYCSGSSNVATIRTPNGPLSVSGMEIGNVSCNDNRGKIVATGLGGWDIAPYEYSLSLESPLGSNNFIETVAFTVNSEFNGLSSGNYKIAIRDVEGCEATYDILLSPIEPVVAAIREPQGLVCPGGNNAVLEAYDPTTGDVVTGTSGASGGVVGAGYKYQLLYLGSDDINDELSRGGLQDSPTFEGVTGGFISAGWYAIEVSSSYECIGHTQPYYVNPPAPIQPRLVQVQAPGCGGAGQIRLSVQNPESGYVYEYRLYNAPPSDPYVEMIGTSVLMDVGPGFYRYDIRKKDISGANVCKSVRSQGISLVDAEQVELVPNMPDDISCASEMDGRIESFAAGGVGNYQYTLYAGDPGDPFSPNATSTIIRPAQDHGTFEELLEGMEYYIGVTSGLSCGEVKGPMEIVRPAVIEFNAVPNQVSCYGQEDGSISIDLISGGEGLVQFAISPDFNKFYSDPVSPNAYTFTDLAPGDYEVLIQDEKGCSEKVVLTISQPDALSASFISSSETCINASDGSAQLTASGGTPFLDVLSGATYFETKIIGPNSIGDEVFSRNDSLFMDNLIGGKTYVVFIRDAMGCETDVIVPISIGVDLTSEPNVEYGCEGIFPNNTVNIRMADTTLLSHLLFSLDEDDLTVANTQTTFGNLPAGDHTVYIYHENGCSTYVEFSIDAFDPLTLVAVKTGPNEITATATGGFGGYEFFFQGESQGSDNVFLSNQDANVTVRVVDQNGCEALVSIPFKFTGQLNIPNFFTPNGDGKNDTWFPGNKDFFPNMEVKIYDRYGRVVAVLNEVSGWDGTYEGREMPSGDYWYEVNANDQEKQRFMGHFTLYR